MRSTLQRFPGRIAPVRWLAVSLVIGGMAMAGCGEQPGRSVGGVIDERIIRELVREGDGPPVTAGRRVEVHYQRFSSDGRVMLDTRSRGRPHAWVVGDRSTFVGLDRAIRGLPEGSIWTITIPPDLHESYLRSDSRSDFDPNARNVGPVVYRVEIVRVSDPPAIEEPSDRLLPSAIRSAPAKRNPNARPSRFPLVNVTRGWGV